MYVCYEDITKLLCPCKRDIPSWTLILDWVWTKNVWVIGLVKESASYSYIGMWETVNKTLAIFSYNEVEINFYMFHLWVIHRISTHKGYFKIIKE